MTPIADLPPRDQRAFEDYPEGAVFTFGSTPVDEAEVIAFAKRYDPQSFHVDPEAAAAGPFGGVIASGWHTGGLMMRMLVDQVLPAKASLGSPGVDELRWLLPVRPGDTLHGRMTVLSARASRSKPDRGLVIGLIEVMNQAGEVVMTLKPTIMLRRRPA